MNKKDTKIVQIRRLRLKEWIDKFYGSQSAFINKVDINQGELSSLLKTKPFGEKKARALEIKAGMGEYWLDTPYDENIINASNENKPSYQCSNAQTIKTTRIPIINNIQAGKWSEIREGFSTTEAIDFIIAPCKVSERAYALKIVGDSMTNPFGKKSIPEGSVVIIEPELHPLNGSIVVAMLDDSNEATIKQLIIDGNRRYLKPLNPQYPIIEINGNCTICGVAIKQISDI